MKKPYQHIPPSVVLRLREEGYTMKEIGNHYGVSRQRIFQLLNEHPDKPMRGWDVKAWRERRKERNKVSE